MQHFQSHVTQLTSLGVFNKDFHNSNSSLPFLCQICPLKKKKKKKVIFAVNLPKTSFPFSISMSKMTSFADGLWKDANYSITTYASSCTVQLCGA